MLRVQDVEHSRQTDGESFRVLHSSSGSVLCVQGVSIDTAKKPKTKKKEQTERISTSRCKITPMAQGPWLLTFKESSSILARPTHSLRTCKPKKILILRVARAHVSQGLLLRECSADKISTWPRTASFASRLCEFQPPPRILHLDSFDSAKRKANWVLKYVKSAIGETDCPDTIPEFIAQRRRQVPSILFDRSLIPPPDGSMAPYLLL